MKKLLILGAVWAYGLTAAHAADLRPYSLSPAAGDSRYFNIPTETSAVTLTGPLTLAGSSLTVTGSAFSVGTSTFVVTGGKVGVGTASPERLFEVAPIGRSTAFSASDATTWSDIQVRNPAVTAGAATGIGFVMGGAGVNNSSIGIAAVKNEANDRDADMVFITRPKSAVSAERMRIDRNGFVGIGTTSPASKVDISSGTIRMAGTGAPTTGGALCLNSAGAMAKCTSAIDASGNCTCP